MSSLTGKTALITGAAAKRGMGRAIALRLASEGADIAIMDKFKAPRSLFPGDEKWGGLDEEVKEISALGRKAIALVTDVTKASEVEAAIAETARKLGKIDILIHCAAIRGPVGTPLIDHTEKDWRDVLEVNVLGTFLISRAVAKQMIAQGKGGKILIFASMAGTHGVEGSSAYCASKYATIGLVKSLALEVARYQITVNAVNPGIIITNLRDTAFEKMAKDKGVTPEEVRQADYKQMGARIPMGRMGSVEDIANLAWFLVSDYANYLTAETIGVTGGVI